MQAPSLCCCNLRAKSSVLFRTGFSSGFASCCLRDLRHGADALEGVGDATEADRKLSNQIARCFNRPRSALDLLRKSMGPLSSVVEDLCKNVYKHRHH